MVGEADSVNSVSASACHLGGPKGVSPGQKALLHGNEIGGKTILEGQVRTQFFRGNGLLPLVQKEGFAGMHNYFSYL